MKNFSMHFVWKELLRSGLANIVKLYLHQFRNLDIYTNLSIHNPFYIKQQHPP